MKPTNHAELTNYAKLRQKIHNTRDMIDGGLNRIMVTDDAEEIRHLAYYLFHDINELMQDNHKRIAMQNKNQKEKEG